MMIAEVGVPIAELEDGHNEYQSALNKNQSEFDISNSEIKKHE
jgi:hypothetical protein